MDFFENLKAYQRFIQPLADSDPGVEKYIKLKPLYSNIENVLYTNFIKNLKETGSVDSKLFYSTKNTYIPFNTL
jgi:hypothetical protein